MGEHMKLGFVSAILHDLSLEEVFQFAAKEGFACVEAMCWPPGKAERKFAGATHIDVTNFSMERGLEINLLASKYGVEISALGYYPNPLDPDESASGAVIKHLKQVIAAAKILNLSTVNTFVGRDWTKSGEANWPRFLQTWEPIIRFADLNDVRIAIENCPMLFSLDEWPVGKNLAMCPAIWTRM